MKLTDEHLRSYIDDIKEVGLLRFLTWNGNDVAATWKGGYTPASHLDDAEMASLVKFNRDHYLYYRALVERYVAKRGDVLDIGCGSGARTAMLARYANRVIGVDSDLLKVSAAAHINNVANIEWIGADFMSWQPDMTADYAFAVEVVEHIPLEAQEGFFDKALGCLKPGGLLLMTTPKDREVKRKHPHIGLWTDDEANAAIAKYGARIEYFTVHNLRDGGEQPWCSKDDATHYVIVVEKK